MRITVLGKSPAWQDAGGACSGYLVEEHGACLLLDCGNGVFSKLRNFCDYVDVDAVVISHLHADHILDLVPFASALTFAPRQQPVPVDRWPGTDNPARPHLYVPAGGRDALRRVAAVAGCARSTSRTPSTCTSTPPRTSSRSARCGCASIAFRTSCPRCAVDVSSANGGGRFTYGADSAPNEELVRFADGTDLLMIEATLPRPEREGPRGHLTPSEAGEHGSRARVRRLVLTHISDELDADWAQREAEKAFGGPVDVAVEGAVFTV